MGAEDRYLEKQDSRLRDIATDLISINTEKLKKLQEAYEAGLRDRMFSLSLSDTQGVREVHSLLKGSRTFVSWIETQKNKLGGVRNDRGN